MSSLFFVQGVAGMRDEMELYACMKELGTFQDTYSDRHRIQCHVYLLNEIFAMDFGYHYRRKRT